MMVGGKTVMVLQHLLDAVCWADSASGGTGDYKKVQLGQGHYLGEGSWRAAPPNIAVQHCLAKGSEMAKSRSASEAKNPTKKVLCQLACILVTLSVNLHCPCAQKCCSFIHSSEKQTNKQTPQTKTPRNLS